MSIRIGIAGIAGRMGKLLAEEVAAAGASLSGGLKRGEDAAALFAASDVVIDFTHADSATAHAAAAVAAGKPLVLMFSLPECPYCKVVRRNYLGPLLREANPPVIRELTMTSRQSIHDYDGSWTTPVAIAKRYGVVVAPTLVFVDGSGEKLVDPLVGGDHAFYDAYLERALQESRRRLRTRERR